MRSTVASYVRGAEPVFLVIKQYVYPETAENKGRIIQRHGARKSFVGRDAMLIVVGAVTARRGPERGEHSARWRRGLDSF